MRAQSGLFKRRQLAGFAARAALLAILGMASASAQTQRVRIVIGSHLPQATDKSTTYAASCGQIAYQLRVNAADNTVTLRRSDAPDIDLSTTSVGMRLLEEDVLVQVGFNCPQNALNIFLKGVKLVDLGMPSGFRDAVSVKSNGEVGKTSPASEHLEELAIPHTGTSVVKSAVSSAGRGDAAQ